jgi:hypothetical protein
LRPSILITNGYFYISLLFIATTIESLSLPLKYSLKGIQKYVASLQK